MFVAIYRFSTKADKQKQFKQAWHEMTKLIYEHEGSLGSRLHRESETEYIAYAQWPDRKAWQDSGNNLPETANKIRQAMQDSCEKIETLHELTVVDDLLETKTKKD